MSHVSQPTAWPRIHRALSVGHTLIGVMPSATQRKLWREAWQFSRGLDAALQGVPLPDFMQRITPVVDLSLPHDTVRRIADAVAYLDRACALGICLHRSLLRYHFLRRAGLPVVIQFGVRRKTDGIGGHAWLNLYGEPYHELAADYAPFVVVYHYPPSPSMAG